MCTSLISNRNKTIVGWNLDMLNAQYRISKTKEGVYLEIYDFTEGWLPLFGANNKGEFVGMPTCWPHDSRSNPVSNDQINIINLDIDLLLQKRTFEETLEIVKKGNICSIPGLTFMGSLSDADGNVLHVIPGQGYKYYKKPKYAVLTNFSPFKGDTEQHPWMGLDRYKKVTDMLENVNDNFDVDDCFKVLEAVSQTECPTIVSMVFDVSELKVYWCENRDFNAIESIKL